MGEAGVHTVGGDDPDSIGFGRVGAEGAHEVSTRGQGAAGNCQGAIVVNVEVVARGALSRKQGRIVTGRRARAAAADRFERCCVDYTL